MHAIGRIGLYNAVPVSQNPTNGVELTERRSCSKAVIIVINNTPARKYLQAIKSLRECHGHPLRRGNTEIGSIQSWRPRPRNHGTA